MLFPILDMRFSSGALALIITETRKLLIVDINLINDGFFILNPNRRDSMYYSFYKNNCKYLHFDQKGMKPKMACMYFSKYTDAVSASEENHTIRFDNIFYVF